MQPGRWAQILGGLGKMEVGLRTSDLWVVQRLKEAMLRFGGSQSLLLPWLGHPCLEHTRQGRNPGQLDMSQPPSELFPKI